MRVAVLALAAWIPAAALPAFAGPGQDPVAWLQRAVEAARTGTYAGIVVHATGERSSVTRIAHFFANGTEVERIEALDGPRQEIVRRGDELQCYYPDAKTVRLDRRVTARFFPTLIFGPPEALAEHYDVKLGSVERLLDYECQWIHLDPKDTLRYAQRLCAEVTTGLLVRARTLGQQKRVLEQFGFSELRLGSAVPRSELKSPFRALSKDWVKDTRPLEESRQVDTGWLVAAPAGFRKVTEMARTVPGRDRPVSQLVYTDGIASFSVFIEPLATGVRVSESASAEGDLSISVRPLSEYVVTVLGEVPPAAVQQVARGVTRRP